MMERKNQILITVLGVFALVIVTVGVSFAFFNYTRTGQIQNIITTGTKDYSFGFNNESGVVTLTDAVPLTVEQGTKLTPYTFKIQATMPQNTTVKYTVYAINDTEAYIQKEKTDNQKTLEKIEEKDIMLDLREENGQSLVQKKMSELTASDQTNEKKVHEFTHNTGTDQTTIDKKYELRIWLNDVAGGFGHVDANDQGSGKITQPEGDNSFTTSDGKTVTSTTANKAFSMRIRVEATVVANPVNN